MSIYSELLIGVAQLKLFLPRVRGVNFYMRKKLLSGAVVVF